MTDDGGDLANEFQFHKGTIRTQEEAYKSKSDEISIP